MRRLIFLLMIALLPLRGWMGEAMATEMAAINMIAIQATNTPTNANLASENSMSGCDMHKTIPAGHSTDKPSCTHCQACHSTGLLSTVQISSFNHTQYAQPLAEIIQFVSASIAHSQKPPIL
jgi:hypothetical protein